MSKYHGVLFMDNKNTGKHYEKLAQLIFSRIINQNIAETIHVQHDVTLKGKTTSHQIDVYWEFDLNGIQYRTIIQAKDWKNKVKKEQMLAFKAILDDLPVGTNGIFVARNGFQSGAIEVAQAHGIAIYELREPIDADWGDTITEINIKMLIQFPRCKNLNLQIDQNWVSENDIDTYLLNDQCLRSNCILTNKNGTPVCTLADVIQECLHQSSTEELTTIIKDFDDNTFIKLSDTQFVKLKCLSGDFGYKTVMHTIKISIEDIVKLILKDITKNNFFRFDKQYRLINKNE